MLRDVWTGDEGWRVRWYARDFSWAGLSKFKEGVAGTDWASLQDYWRADVVTGNRRSDEELVALGELVTFEDTLWHIAHLPIRGRSSQFSKKHGWTEQRWADLEKLIARRVAWSVQQRHGGNGVALCRGVVVRSFPDFPGEPDLRFDWACFMSEDVRLVSRNVGFLCVSDAVFSGEAHLERLRIGEQLQCFRTQFRKAVSFDQTRCGTEAFFAEAEFGEGVWFHRTVFAGQAVFDRAKIKGYAGFHKARFERDSYFVDAVFLGRIRFEHASFTAAPSLHAATLNENIVFDGIKFPDYVLAQWLAFAITAALLVGCISAYSLYSASGGFAALFYYLLALVLAALSGASLRLGGEAVAAGLGIEDLADDSHGFRKLARIAEGQRNRRHAAQFHRLELKAHRLRSDSDPFERFFSWLYDVLGGYGESIWRPLAAATIGSFAFALVYWSWAVGGISLDFMLSHLPWIGRMSPDPEFVPALRFSVENMVRPFSVWSVDGGQTPCRFVDQLLAQLQECRSSLIASKTSAELALHDLAVRVTASVQTILSLTLLFLFGLALRRKFQVGN